jgi:hypothetical protein
MAVLVLIVARQPANQLPVVAGAQNLAILALGGLGLAGLASTTEPLPAGLGLLLLLSGFELFYAAVDQSLTVFAVLVVANLLLALAIAYLVKLRHTPDDDLLPAGLASRPIE